MIDQTVLPLKLEQSNDLIAAQVGQALLGEFIIGMGLLEALDKRSCQPRAVGRVIKPASMYSCLS
jgi:hypothetical protein